MFKMTREIHAPDTKIMTLGYRVHPKFWMLKTIKILHISILSDITTVIVI